MPLSLYLEPGQILPDLPAGDRDVILAALVAPLLTALPGLDRSEALDALRRREDIGSTGIGGGLAIPHAKAASCPRIAVVLARSAQGRRFNAADGRDCHIFCMLLAPPEAMHLAVLGAFARILKENALQARLLTAPDAAAMWELMNCAWKD